MNKQLGKVTLCIATLAVIAASPAHAQDFAPVTGTLNKIATWLTGDFARAAATIAIVGSGLAFMAGRMAWQIFMPILIGIILVFGAATIVAGFS